MAGCSLSRFFSISATDWRRLSRLSWTLWDWAMDFCSRSERSAICWERLWKRLTMASAKFSAKENQRQRASRLVLREQQGSPLAPAKVSLTTNPCPQTQQRDRGPNTNGQPGSQPRANTSPEDALLCAFAPPSPKSGRLHLSSLPGLFSHSPQPSPLTQVAALFCTCCFLNVPVVRGRLSLYLQQGPSCFLELLHRHLMLSEVSLQLLLCHETRQNQWWVTRKRPAPAGNSGLHLNPAEGSCSLNHKIIKKNNNVGWKVQPHAAGRAGSEGLGCPSAQPPSWGRNVPPHLLLGCPLWQSVTAAPGRCSEHLSKRLAPPDLQRRDLLSLQVHLCA